jgi:hypothetical protein
MQLSVRSLVKVSRGARLARWLANECNTVHFMATSDGIFEGDGGKVCDQPDGWGTGEVEVARSGRVRHGQTLEAVPWRGVYKAPLKLATQVLTAIISMTRIPAQKSGKTVHKPRTIECVNPLLSTVVAIALRGVIWEQRREILTVCSAVWRCCLLPKFAPSNNTTAVRACVFQLFPFACPTDDLSQQHCSPSPPWSAISREQFAPSAFVISRSCVPVCNSRLY